MSTWRRSDDADADACTAPRVGDAAMYRKALLTAAEPEGRSVPARALSAVRRPGAGQRAAAGARCSAVTQLVIVDRGRLGVRVRGDRRATLVRRAAGLPPLVEARARRRVRALAARLACAIAP
jgi:hypothetical protein